MSSQFLCSPFARAIRSGVFARRLPAGRLLSALLILIAAAPATAQVVSFTTLDTPVTQDFNSLPSTGSATWTNGTTLSGWYNVRTSGTTTTIAADTGSGTTAGLLSYGSASSSDRALGSINSNAVGDFYSGILLQNNTGSTITSLDVAYTGEQWRNNGNATAQKLVFSYVVGAPTVSVVDFAAISGAASTPVTALDFTGPIATASAGALDGNAAANRSAQSTTITGLSIPNGTQVMLRWFDHNDSGNDHGLAVDDFSVTPHSVAGLPTLSINDVSLSEGNAGTTTYTFTVTLSAMSASNVTFDIATADSTATAPFDYTTKSLTTQTIPAGSTIYSFSVLVNGDTSPETNETFFVNLVNASGAVIADGQGVGTIVNDDAAASLTIADVSHSEGNAGTTAYVFTVSLDTPAPAGGVTFDIATADGTATAPSDYTSRSLTGQTIPAGSSTYAFTVNVNGDTTTEPDETFTVNVTNLTNAILTDGQAVGTIVNDDIQKIHDVQGNGAATPIPGATVTVEGVATAIFLGANKLNGFFLQEEDADADADPNTSEGIFVFCSACVANSILEGQRVRVTGSVSEFQALTEITTNPAGVLITDFGNHMAEVTPSPVSLPISGDVDAFYEARESMLITYVDTLTVSEYFELFRFGQIELVGGDRPRTYTEDNAPSVAGYATHLQDLARRQVILDDDNNAQEAPLLLPDGSQFVYYPRANGGFSGGTQGVDFFRGGDQVHNLTGVLQWGFPGFGANTWRIRPSNTYPTSFTVANPRPATPPNVGGSIRAVGMNLLNYFTTIDTTSSNSAGPCGPSGGLDCRGADSVAELNRQRDRASIVVCTLNPDVAAFMELENTTPSATITDLLGAVNASCGGAHPYAYVNTGGTLGTDAIRVAQIYRTGILSPVGSPLVDLDPIHNRPPTAQTYDVVDATNPAFGKRFTVVANHFKSKGSCPTSGADADQLDGQSCWAATRTLQSTRLLTWINGTVIPAAGDPDVLLLGDFNSYAHETPVTTIEAGGYHDLETELHGVNSYSYLFSGELGHLDFAFASNSFASQVTGADAWHINADEADLFDYNDEIKDTGEAAFEEKPNGSALVPPRVVFQPGTPYRASDHDPVLVGLFGATDVAISLTDAPDPVVAGSNITYTITATNNGPLNADAAAWTDTLPAGTTFTSLVTPAGWSCTNPGVGSGGTINCNAVGTFAVGNATFTLVVTVGPAVAGGTVLSNTATITTSSADTNAANNSATSTTTVTASPQPHLTIAPTSVPFGNQAVGTTSAGSTVTLTNDGAASLSVTALTSATAPFARAGGTCSVTPITIAAGSSCTLIYTFAPTVAGAANQVLTVTTSAPSNSPTITLAGTGLQAPTVAKSFSPTSITVNGDSVATITLTNPNASAITLTASLVDNLPSGLVPSAVATSCTGTVSSTASSMTLASGATIPANGSCTLNAHVTAATAGSYTNTIAAGALQTNAGNNPAAASATLTVTPLALVAPTVAKSFTPASVLPNANSTATITLSNPNASAITLSAALVDTLPAGLIASSAATTCSTGAGSFTAGSLTLSAGATIPASSSCTLTGTVHSPTAGSYVNTIAAGALQTNAGNNAAAASATLTVTSPPPCTEADKIFCDGFEGVSIVSEDFADITTLVDVGWLMQNNSAPLGTSGWFQGNDAVFPAQGGDATSYIGANFNNTAGTGTISDWLVTPLLTFDASSSIAFYTRSTLASDGSSVYPDRLEVRLCTGAVCSDVGSAATDVGQFSTLLKSINPNLGTNDDPTGATGYPLSWALFTLGTSSGLPSTGQGRVAFRYFVTNGGPAGANSNFIGIDSVSIHAADFGRELGSIGPGALTPARQLVNGVR